MRTGRRTGGGSRVPVSEFGRQLGQLLRAERLARQWTLREASRKIGCVAAATLRSYEDGSRAIGCEALSAIAAGYGVPAEELIPGER